MRACLLSNVVMLFPALVAYRAGMTYTAAAVLACAALSAVYHLDEEHGGALLADVAGVIVMVGTIGYTLLQSAALLTPMNVASLAYGAAGLGCYLAAGDDTHSERYQEYHSCWHVLVAYMIAATLYSFTHTTVRVSRSRLARPLFAARPAAAPSTTAAAAPPAVATAAATGTPGARTAPGGLCGGPARAPAPAA
jgi:hypothetical protein